MESQQSSVVLTSVFMALEGAFAYSAFLPSIMTIGTFVDSKAKVDMIRQGELTGTIFLAALAIVTGFIMQSIWPVVMGALAGAGALFVYERALQNSPAFLEGVD